MNDPERMALAVLFVCTMLSWVSQWVRRKNTEGECHTLRCEIQAKSRELAASECARQYALGKLEGLEADFESGWIKEAEEYRAVMLAIVKANTLPSIDAGDLPSGGAK